MANYTFAEDDVFDELPPLPGGEQKSSALTRNVDALQKVSGRWKPIASYDDRAKAAASCVSLRKRFGDRADVQGYEFAARPDAEGQWVVLGKFDSDKITETGAAEWEKRKAARSAKYQATRAKNSK
jgi:hypothetical protein